MVRVLPDPPLVDVPRFDFPRINGAVAQLGEHLLCKQGVTGSIPVSSTNLFEILPKGGHPQQRGWHAQPYWSKQTGKLVDVTGIEPVTPCLQSRCSPS